MIMVRGPHDGTAAPAEILAVGGKSYAFGLRWTSVASRTSLVDEAQTAALAEEANAVVLHRAFNQFGLATIRDLPQGLRGAMYRPLAGAAAIADAAGAATLAAFPLEDGRWLVLAIDRKGILPDGDAIAADAEQAKARIQAWIAQSPASWRRKFVPADWGIADSRMVSPQDLLVRSHAPQLVSLWVLAHRRRIGLALVTAAVAVAAGLLLAVRLAMTPQPVAESPSQPPKPVAAVWTPAGLAIDRCLSAFRDAQRFIAVPGWQPTKYVCQGGEGVTISFARAGDGQISAIKSLVPAAQIADDGQSAVLALPLPSLPHLSATSLFAPRRQYQLIGLDLAQRLNGSFTIQAVRKALPGETAAPVPNRAWQSFAWSYQTQAPAIAWAAAIARLGSISVDTLTFSPADNFWQLSGSLYASN